MDEAAEIRTQEKEIFPLTAEIEVSPITDDMWRIKVGNTGLNIFVSKLDVEPETNSYIWRQHYTPDGQLAAVKGKEQKYTLIYAYALTNFLNWWQDKENFKYGFPRYNRIDGIADATMHNFRCNLLGTNNGLDIYQMTGKHKWGEDYIYEYCLNLDKLNDNTKIKQRLKRLSEKCRRQNYFMKEEA